MPDAPTQPTQGKTRSDVDSQASSSGTANDSRTDTPAPDGGPATGPMPVWPQERPAPETDPAALAGAAPAGGPYPGAAGPAASGQPVGAGYPADPGTSAPGPVSGAAPAPLGAGPGSAGPGPMGVQAGPPPMGAADVTTTMPGPYPVTGPVDDATQTFPTMPGVPRRDAVLGMQSPAPGHGLMAEGPRMRQLAIAAIWALVLCFGGIGCGVWALVAILAGATTGWFEPTIIVTGIVGLAFTAAAFPLVDRRGLPWLLLGLGTATLITGFVLTANAV